MADETAPAGKRRVEYYIQIIGADEDGGPLIVPGSVYVPEDATVQEENALIEESFGLRVSFGRVRRATYHESIPAMWQREDRRLLLELPVVRLHETVEYRERPGHDERAEA